MSDDARRGKQRDEMKRVSRRRFLEHIAAAGGAALVGPAADAEAGAL